MAWTTAQEETLKRLWQQGLSAAKIADQLGDNISRVAVIGKAHQLKLKERGKGWRPQSQGEAAPQTEAAETKAKPAEPQPKTEVKTFPKAEPPEPLVSAPRTQRIEDANVPISRRLGLTDLNERTCKWPSGDLQTKDFSFCGNEARSDRPYCHYHSRLAYQPASVRRRMY